MHQIRKGRYTKTISPTTQARRNAKRRFRWFRQLSWRKKIAIIALPIVLFLIVTPIATYMYYANDIADQERLMNRNNTGIVLTDKDGTAFYSIGQAEHRKLIPLDAISKDMKNALVASEDKDFYKHSGFNILSIGRALLTNISGGSLNAYGGSTLTQQLAKNTLLSKNKTFLRKYQELAISVAIERQYTKDQILDMYLNSVYYGENAFGIEDAAKTYFNKEPKDLNLAESAMLVGVLPAPSAYSPISGSMEYAKQRQKTVLTRMKDNGYISEEQMNQAITAEIAYQDPSSTTSKAPHFVEMIIKELSDKYGYEQVMRSGYQVRTTLDAGLQDRLEANAKANLPHIQANGGSNVGAVAIDPKTGSIRALMGSIDYTNDQWGKVNIATTARQPGSSFKPIYYAGALAKGMITPASVYRDERTTFGDWTPRNALGTFNGDVTVRKALDWSLNIPAVKILQEYGIDNAVATANQLGITTLDANKQYDLTLALGSAEATPLQMTNAYAAFGNGGKVFTPQIISEISDKFNTKIYTASSLSKQAISQGGAYLISSILSDSAARAGMFGSSLTVSGHTVAVKTGTTSDSRDAWTIGYTPSLALGVWVGNNDNAAMISGGADMAGPIWRLTMQQTLANQPDEPFAVPSSVVQRATCYSNHGIATNSITEGIYQEYYLSSALPRTSCTPQEPQPVTVCNLESKTIETIDEKDSSDQKYSKNLDDCKKKTTISVCDTTTGHVVMIDEDAFDAARYSKDTAHCQKTDDTTDTNPVTPPTPATPPPATP
jgi:1A family penicillin-binding protein